MVGLLLALIYLIFISLGLPDAMLGVNVGGVVVFAKDVPAINITITKNIIITLLNVFITLPPKINSHNSFTIVTYLAKKYNTPLKIVKFSAK